MSSVVAAGAVGVIIGVLASMGLQNLNIIPTANGQSIYSGNNLIATIPNAILATEQQELVELQNLRKPFSRAFLYLKRVAVGAGTTVKASIPDIRNTNPYPNVSKVINLSLVPDANAKLHLFAQIDHNDSDNLLNFVAGDLTDVSVLNVPLPNEGLNFNTYAHTNFYFWTDGTASNITVYELVGVK